MCVCVCVCVSVCVCVVGWLGVVIDRVQLFNVVVILIFKTVKLNSTTIIIQFCYSEAILCISVQIYYRHV